MAAGRDPTTIRRIVNVPGVITDGRHGDGALDGPVDQWIETLVRWAREYRVDAFVVWPPDPGPDMVERLAADVVPAVREALGRA